MGTPSNTTLTAPLSSGPYVRYVCPVIQPQSAVHLRGQPLKAHLPRRASLLMLGAAAHIWTTAHMHDSIKSLLLQD